MIIKSITSNSSDTLNNTSNNSRNTEIRTNSFSIDSIYEKNNIDFSKIIEKNLINVTSYHSREIEDLSMLLESNDTGMFKINNNFYFDLESLSSDFFKKVSKTEYFNQSYESNIEYFEFIRLLDKYSILNEINYDRLNFGNKINNFFIDEESNEISKNLKNLLNNTKSIVENERKEKTNELIETTNIEETLLLNQSFTKNINNSKISETIFNLFSFINTSNNNYHIFNTDKIISQIIYNIGISESIYHPFIDELYNNESSEFDNILTDRFDDFYTKIKIDYRLTKHFKDFYIDDSYFLESFLKSKKIYRKNTFSYHNTTNNKYSAYTKNNQNSIHNQFKQYFLSKNLEKSNILFIDECDMYFFKKNDSTNILGLNNELLDSIRNQGTPGIIVDGEVTFNRERNDNDAYDELVTKLEIEDNYKPMYDNSSNISFKGFSEVYQSFKQNEQTNNLDIVRIEFNDKEFNDWKEFKTILSDVEELNISREEFNNEEYENNDQFTNDIIDRFFTPSGKEARDNLLKYSSNESYKNIHEHKNYIIDDADYYDYDLTNYNINIFSKIKSYLIKLHRVVYHHSILNDMLVSNYRYTGGFNTSPSVINNERIFVDNSQNYIAIDGTTNIDNINSSFFNSRLIENITNLQNIIFKVLEVHNLEKNLSYYYDTFGSSDSLQRKFSSLFRKFSYFYESVYENMTLVLNRFVESKEEEENARLIREGSLDVDQNIDLDPDYAADGDFNLSHILGITSNISENAFNNVDTNIKYFVYYEGMDTTKSVYESQIYNSMVKVLSNGHYLYTKSQLIDRIKEIISYEGDNLDIGLIVKNGNSKSFLSWIKRRDVPVEIDQENWRFAGGEGPRYTNQIKDQSIFADGKTRYNFEGAVGNNAQSLVENLEEEYFGETVEEQSRRSYQTPEGSDSNYWAKINGILHRENIRRDSTGYSGMRNYGLTPQDQFLNIEKSNQLFAGASRLPVVYRYLENSINSVLEGSYFNLTAQSDDISVVTYNPYDEHERLSDLLDREYDNPSEGITIQGNLDKITELTVNKAGVLNISNEFSASYQNEIIKKDIQDIYRDIGEFDLANASIFTFKSIYDLHCYSYNKEISCGINHIRDNYIEPVSILPDSDEDLLLMFCKLDNDINKFKESKNNIDLTKLKNIYNKIIKKSNENIATDNFVKNDENRFLYLYGNDTSDLKVFKSSDEEYENFIQDDIFVNNYNRNYFFNNKTIFSSQKRIDENIEVSVDQDLIDNLKKYLSIISGNNYFKNTKTMFLKVLKDFVDFKNKNFEIFSPNAINNRAWAKKESVRKKIILNSYENYICNIFKNNTSFSESKEFIKRLLTYIFSKRYGLIDEERLKEVSFNNLENISNCIYKIHPEAINYINTLNSNSKKINNFLFSEKNVKKLKKYTLLRYKNIGQELYKQSLKKPLEIYNFCNFPSNTQNYVNFFTYLTKNGIDYNKRNHVDQTLGLLINETSFYEKTSKQELKLNIPNIEVKKIKKLSDNISLEEIEEDFYYKFDSKCLDRLWLCKSRIDKIGIGQFESLKIQFNKEDGKPLSKTIEEDNELYDSQIINDDILSTINIESINIDFPELDMFYSTISEEGTILKLLSSTIINFFDSSNITFSKKDSYEDIFKFFEKEENNDIVKIVFNMMMIYSNIFSIFFDRLSTDSMYILINNLEKEKDDEDCTLNSTREVLLGESINKRYKDIEDYYNYLISLDDSSNFNLDLISNKNKTVNTKIILEDNPYSIYVIDKVYSKCVIHDYMKYFSYDVLRSYYDHLKNINSFIENSLQNDSIDKLEEYYSEISLNSEDTFSLNSKNIFYLNNVSKKIQNSFYEKKQFKKYFLEGDLDIDDKYKTKLYFNNKKKTKENEYNLLKLTYEKINNIFKDYTHFEESVSFLKNRKYDFIKIGIDFNFLNNINFNNVIKFTVYKVNHDNMKVSSRSSDYKRNYYYTPTLTSLPASYYDIVKEFESPMLGYFNVNNKISERFQVLELEAFLEVDFIKNIYQGSILNGNSNVNNYPVFEKYFELVEANNSMFGSAYNIFSSMYFSSFCHYYERLINNYNDNFNFLNENIDDRIVNTDFVNSVTNLSTEDFEDVFNENVDNFNYTSYNSFSKTKTFSFEIENNTKNHTFINQLSSNQTNIDIYKNIARNKFYDYFNIMIESKENENASYVIEVNIL